MASVAAPQFSQRVSDMSCKREREMQGTRQAAAYIIDFDIVFL